MLRPLQSREIPRRCRGAQADVWSVLTVAILCFLSLGWITLRGAGPAAPVHPLDGSFAREWLVLGPFPSREMETDFLEGVGGEANVTPKEGDSVTTKAGTRLVWTHLRSDRDLVDLERALENPQWSVVYAYCEVDAPEAATTDARMTPSLGGMVFWNGQRVGTFPASVPFDVPGTLPLQLRRGQNRCLLKLRSGFEPPYAFAFQPLPPGRGRVAFHVTDTAGHPVPGAHIQLFSNGTPSARLQTDNSGNAEACLFPLSDSYEAQITSDKLGAWPPAFSVRGAERKRLEVVLEPSVSISGNTLAMDGSPQASIVLQALRVDDDTPSIPKETLAMPYQTGFASGPQINRAAASAQAALGERPAATPIPSLLPMPPFSQSTVSDADGSFQFVNLKPGHYRLQAHGEHELVPFENGRTFTVATGQTTRGVTFSFPEVRRGTIRRFQVRRGLTEVMPLSLQQAPDGMLWIGTFENSLHTFDGLTLKEIPAPNVQLGYVNALAQDSSGRVWVGSEKGISRVVGGKVESAPISEKLSTSSVGKVLADPDGTVWFSTTAGLVERKGETFRRWTITNGLPSNPVGGLLRAREGGLWLTTLRSVAHFDGQRFSEPVSLSGYRSMTGDRLYQTRDGAIWFSSRAQETAVYRYDGSRLSRVGGEDGLQFNLVNDIAETSDGTVWFATEKGLVSFSGATLHIYPGVGEIARILVDADDVLWCSTPTDIVRLDRRTFVGITQRDGLAPKKETAAVYAIEPDRNGGYLLGTEWGGVYRLESGKHNRITPMDYLTNQYVRHIVRSPDGALWFGTAGGIFRQAAGRLERVVDRDWIIGMDFDNQGVLWFGQGWVGGGVTSFDPRTGLLSTFTRKDGLPDDSVWAVQNTPDGGLFIGTGAGLAEFRDGRLRSVDDRIGVRLGTVISLGRNEDGSLWIGGDSGGKTLRGTNLIALGATNAAAPEGVWSKVRTADGIIWFGTDRNGIIGYDGQATTQLDKRDGLLGDRIFCLRPDQEDSLLVGFVGVNGVMRYRRTKSAPTVHFVETRLEGRSFSSSENLPVTAIDKPVNVAYQEIDLKTHPEKRQFYYRVLGPEGNTLFSGITKERRFEWTPGKGGTYRFEVQAIDRDLNYSQVARMSVRAFVPWFANAWIIVPGGALFLGLLAWGIVTFALYLRKSREADRLRERERIARDLHDNLGAGLTHLAMLGDIFQQHPDLPPTAKVLASRVGESALGLSRSIGEVIWATDPAKDTLESFVSYVSSYAERFFSVSDVRLRLDLPPKISPIVLSTDTRHNLFMVLMEALNNIVKHAHATEVRITLEINDRQICLTVEDNGRGFVKGEFTPGGGGNGLTNMENRLADLGGELRIESTTGKGTRIDARAPLP